MPAPLAGSGLSAAISMSHTSRNSDKKQCRIMSIFAMTKKRYPQNEISIYILIHIKIIIKNENKRRFVLMCIKIRIIIYIKMSIRITIIILMRIIINIKIRLDTIH